MNKLIPITAGAVAALTLALALAPAGRVAAENHPPATPLSAGPALPPGPGYDEVAAKCVACHRATQIVDRRMSEDEWSTTVDRMIGLGAKVTEDDRPIVLSYLNANFGTGETQTEKPKSGD